MAVAGHELILDAKTGKPRQAGTIGEFGSFIFQLREHAESSLYFFAKQILGYNLFSPAIHLRCCQFLQTCPPLRKLLMLPRDHFKTTMNKALALHLFVQPEGKNLYFPKGMGHGERTLGSDTRVLFASKTVGLAQTILGEIKTRIETNRYLHALWPQCFWAEPRKEARVWNNERILLPRDRIDKEASIDTIGVGGTRTGWHFDARINDDLIDIEDRNSPTVMAGAIEWFQASRAMEEGGGNSIWHC